MKNRFTQRVEVALHELADRDLSEVTDLITDMSNELDVLYTENAELKVKVGKLQYGDF